MLERHCPTPGPGRCKGALPEESACGGHRALIGSTLDRPDRGTHGFPQDLRRTPEPCGLHRLSLYRQDARHAFQADGHVQLAADLPCDRQALLIEGTCSCMLTLAGFDFR